MDHNKIKEIWEGASDVEIVRVGEGETGLTHNQILTGKRLEAIAEWFAIPDEKRDPRDVAGLARALGVSPASIRKWQKDPRMARRVVQKTREYMAYMMPNVIWSLYKRAIQYEDVSAAKALIASQTEPGGRAINVMTQVNVGSNQNQIESGDDRVLEEVNRVVERRVRARLSVVPGSRTAEEIQRDQGKETMAALYADSSDQAVPSIDSSDPSTGGS